MAPRIAGRSCVTTCVADQRMNMMHADVRCGVLQGCDRAGGHHLCGARRVLIGGSARLTHNLRFFRGNK